MSFLHRKELPRNLTTKQILTRKVNKCVGWKSEWPSLLQTWIFHTVNTSITRKTFLRYYERKPISIFGAYQTTRNRILFLQFRIWVLSKHLATTVDWRPSIVIQVYQLRGETHSSTCFSTIQPVNCLIHPRDITFARIVCYYSSVISSA